MARGERYTSHMIAISPIFVLIVLALTIPYRMSPAGWSQRAMSNISEAPSNLGSLTPIAAAVRDAYMREFSEPVFRPALDLPNVACGDTTNGHLVTATYIKESAAESTLLYMYMSSDGKTVIEKGHQERVVTPAGRFKVLVIITQYAETIDRRSLRLWNDAQDQINRDHALFALDRKYDSPIVSFENHNLLLESWQVTNPRDMRSVMEAAEKNGVVTRDFDFIVSVNIDPFRPDGGFAGAEDRFVYMGNFHRWQVPLSSNDWHDVARAVYHHEIGHHWGWRHEWSPDCRGLNSVYEPFVAAPVLFGWEDVDGDGLPEILDETPYSRIIDR